VFLSPLKMELIKLIFYTILVLFTFTPLVKWFMKRKKFINSVDKIPGAKSYPLIGTAWEFFGVPRHGKKILSADTQ
jgi:hypothetical protein